MKHEIGNRTYIVADVEPLDVDGVRTVEVGTALWLLGVPRPAAVLRPAEDDGTCGGSGPASPASASACSGSSTAGAGAASAARWSPARRCLRSHPAAGCSRARPAAATGVTSPSWSTAARTSTARRGWRDALLPRGGRVLDAGSGMGRVSEPLRRRGHRVVAAEPDPGLVEQSRRTYPEVDVVPSTALGLDRGRCSAARPPARVRPGRGASAT